MSKKSNKDNKQAPSVVKPEPTGNGLGTVQSRFDAFPKKGKDDKTEPFEDKSADGTAGESTSANAANGNQTHNSWNIANLSDDEVTVLQENVVRKVLAKLCHIAIRQ